MYQAIKYDFDYDHKYDILNIYFSSDQNSAGEENVENIVEFRDAITNNLTRLMVYRFKKMFNAKDAIVLAIPDIEKFYSSISASK